jgi:NAD(P)-dependent dehydrogenase (short-subunit alcohol dehydrogenase family)
MDDRRKTCVITGASAGIGKATAIALAKLGYDVIMLVRDCEKSRTAVEEVRRASDSGSVRMVCVDLASRDSIVSAAAKIEQAGGRIDVLINNAGVYRRSRQLSQDGIEMTLAVNFVAMFVLTGLLLPLMNRESGARIINLTSEHYKSAKLDLDDPAAERGFSGNKAYANSKLLVVIFTLELARRLGGSGITVNCVHPGVVGTDVFREYPAWVNKVLNLFISKPEDGAAPVVYLATSPDVDGQTGRYFSKTEAKQVAGPAADDELRARVWSYGERFGGGDGYPAAWVWTDTRHTETAL